MAYSCWLNNPLKATSIVWYFYYAGYFPFKPQCFATILKYNHFIWITGGTGLDTGCNKPYECKGRQKGSTEKVIRVLMEQKRQRDLEIWRREDEFIALWRSVYRGDVRRRKRGEGWRRGKSDRLDYESTHRRTLFNVSLTFLFSISSPPTLSRWRRMGREEKPRERERERERERGERAQTRVWEETQRSVCTSLKVTRPRQSQGSGFTGGPANQGVGKSGRHQVSAPPWCNLLHRLVASASSSLTIFLIFLSPVLSFDFYAHSSLSSLFCRALVKEL